MRMSWTVVMVHDRVCGDAHDGRVARASSRRGKNSLRFIHRFVSGALIDPGTLGTA
jgi:hypothetical protein